MLAVAMPTTPTPTATLAQSSRVVSAYSGSTVCAICPSTSRATASNWNHDPTNASTGSVSARASRIKRVGDNQRGMGRGRDGRAYDPRQHK